MNIKSSQSLVSEALNEVKTITVDEALKLFNEDINANKNRLYVFINVRESFTHQVY